MKYLLTITIILLSLAVYSDAQAATIVRSPNNIGLVGYWNFDIDAGGTNIVDLSGQGNDGTMTNMDASTDWVDGKIGSGAMDFDGSDDTINISDSDIWHGNAFTWSVWFKYQIGIQTWFMKGAYSSSWSYAFQVNSGGGGVATLFIADETNEAGANFGTSGAIFLQDIWYHTVVVYDGAGSTDADKLKLYQDGVEKTLSFTGTIDPTIENSTGNLTIGDFTGLSREFDGQIDDARIYNRALSAGEIERLYNLKAPTISKPALSDGLVGYWNFDIDAGGTNIVDLSGQGNDGTMTNMDAGTDWVDGKIGSGAMDFDGDAGGNDDKIITPIQGQEFTSAATWCAWVQTSDGGGGTIISTTDGTTDRSILLAKNAGDDSVTFYVTSQASDWDSWIGGSTAINDGLWRHICGVYDGTNDLALYFNGVSVGTIGGTEPASARSVGNLLRINGVGLVTAVTAIIDEVRIYNRVLSAGEIERLYEMTSTKFNASRNTSLTDGLVGMWSFDGADVDWASNTAYDRSGQGNNGTITNMSTSSAPVIGKIGQALSFDGDDDFIEANSPVIPDIFTISTWIKVTNLAALRTVMSQHDSGQAGRFLYQINTNGTISISIGSTSTGGETSIVAGTWTNIVIRRTGTSIEYYQDGVFLDEDTASSDALYTGENFKFGGDSDVSQFLLGQMDDVRVYDRALSPEEISRLYDLGR